MKKRIEKNYKENLNIHNDRGVLYTQEEKLKKLLEVQKFIRSELIKLFEFDDFPTKEIIKHLELIAKRYNCERSKEFQSIIKKLEKLSREIASMKNGRKAEKQTENTLRLLEFDDSTHVLYNFSLKDEFDETEIDALVINPYGLFVIEVKNFSKDMRLNERGVFETIDKNKQYYNLGQKMVTKERLLKKALGEYSSSPIIPIILYGNDYSVFIDEYKMCQISYNGTIINDIRTRCVGETKLYNEDIQKVLLLIKENSFVPKGYCEIDCDSIIEEFMSFINSIQAKNDIEEDSIKNENEGLIQALKQYMNGSELAQSIIRNTPYLLVAVSSGYVGYKLYPIINNK